MVAAAFSRCMLTRYDMIMERRGGILRAFPYHEFRNSLGYKDKDGKKKGIRKVICGVYRSIIRLVHFYNSTLGAIYRRVCPGDEA
jgi:hypothetical protein